MFQDQPDWRNAEVHHQQLHQLFENMLKLFPEDISLQQRVAALQIRLGLDSDQPLRSALVRPVAAQAQVLSWLQQALTIREKLSQLDPKNTVFQVERLLVLARLGRVEQASSILQDLSKLADRDLQLRFQIVCGWSLCAQAHHDEAARRKCFEAALAELTEMVKRGWRDRISLRSDPDLATLQALPAMKQLLAKLN